MPQLLDALSPQQRAAVELTEGPLLILAGAGSGKTRVITYRIVHLIEGCGVPPESILAVTFTNKAADQMKERVARLIPRQLETWPHISTFHSFCVGVLCRHIPHLGYARDFSIYDEDDQQRVVKACIAELGLGELVASPRETLASISNSKNRGLSPEDLYQQAADRSSEQRALIYDLYRRKLRQANALDFDDLLLATVDLLDRAPEVAEEYNRRFRYMLVDEYQDTNRIQYRLIRQLTRSRRNLCLVGDEDQSIYRWRGADIENILNFEKDYPEARVLRLEQNYRSTQSILDAATAVVVRNRARIGKVLWSDRGRGHRIGLVEASDANEEGRYVVDQAARALAGDSDRTVAVLYRTNAQSRVFEEALRARGVGYRVVGGPSFYARAEIKDVLAYARLVRNPRDSAALLRIVNTPARGIGEATLAALEELARQRKLTLWEALEEELAGRGSGLGPRPLKALAGFHGLIEDVARDRTRLSLAGFLKNLLERTAYLDMLQSAGTPESRSRAENLRELLNAAAEADERGVTLAEFLDHAALVSEADDYDERARVTLMTLHSAKGLEFSTVFLVGLEEGLFPHKLSLQEEAALEEERRLCYVSMTRAKDSLVLTWARRRRAYGLEGHELSQASRFLREIPHELIEPLTLAEAMPKVRTTWENALNSVESVRQALRGHVPEGRWPLGAHVRHPKYGVGTVLECEGEGAQAKLTISFPGYGQKKFIEGKAPLERI